jgi:hypothetical protein
MEIMKDTIIWDIHIPSLSKEITTIIQVPDIVEIILIIQKLFITITIQASLAQKEITKSLINIRIQIQPRV